MWWIVTLTVNNVNDMAERDEIEITQNGILTWIVVFCCQAKL